MILAHEIRLAEKLVKIHKLKATRLLNDPDFEAYCKACRNWRESEQILNKLKYKLEGLI